jgi:hypothetical protein
MSAQGSEEAEVNGGPESWRGVLPQKALAIELTKIQLLLVFRASVLFL